MMVRVQNRVRRIRGQSAVMVSFLIMIVVMLIAFTTNLGKLVTEKIAMQNAVDLAVYSGAATQAGYLNKMRDVNQKIWQVHDQVRKFMYPSRTIGYPPAYGGQVCLPCCPPHPSPIRGLAMEPYLTGQQAIITGLTPQFIALNAQAPMAAYGAARSAADQNLSGAGNKLVEKARSPGMLIPAEQKNIEWDYMGWGTGMCGPSPCMCQSMFVTTRRVPSWFYRKSSPRGEVMFAAGIENATPRSNFLDGTYLGQFFSGNCRYGGGGSGRCAMSVYAAAHPYGGKLGSIPMRGGLTHEQMWMPQTENNIPMAPAGVDSNNSMTPHEVLHKDYMDYRVRFIGIFESDAQTLTGQRLSQTAGQYGNRMEH